MRDFLKRKRIGAGILMLLGADETIAWKTRLRLMTILSDLLKPDIVNLKHEEREDILHRNFLRTLSQLGFGDLCDYAHRFAPIAMPSGRIVGSRRTCRTPQARRPPNPAGPSRRRPPVLLPPPPSCRLTLAASPVACRSCRPWRRQEAGLPTRAAAAPQARTPVPRPSARSPKY